MKKLICMLLAFSVLLALTGCGHTHTGGDWLLFAMKHGKICSCGQIYDSGAHTLDDMSVCTVCGAEVFVWDDGTEVSMRDDHGSLIRTISYDTEGNAVCDIRIDCTYDDNGNLKSEMRYVDDILEQECAYENGMLTTDISYFEDGTYAISLYNEMGLSSVVYYNADGKIIGEDYSEYAYDTDGNVYEKKHIVVDADGIKTVCEYDENGELLSKTIYDAEGNVIE